MTLGDRARQREMLEAMLDELPQDAKVTMLAADWDVSPIVEEAGADRLAGGAREDGRDRRPRAGSTSSAPCARRLRGLERPARGAVLFVGLGARRISRGRRRAPLEELRDAHLRLSMVGLAGVPDALRRAVGETGGEAIALRDFEESRPVLADALRRAPAARRLKRAATPNGTCCGR